MKAYRLIPILAIALLIPSFAEAKHAKRNKQRHYSESIHHHRPPHWAPAHGYRVKQVRGHHRRGYNRHRHHRHDDRYYNNRGRSHRRDRGGVRIGGTIVIRF